MSVNGSRGWRFGWTMICGGNKSLKLGDWSPKTIKSIENVIHDEWMPFFISQADVTYFQWGKTHSREWKHWSAIWRNNERQFTLKSEIHTEALQETMETIGLTEIWSTKHPEGKVVTANLRHKEQLFSCKMDKHGVSKSLSCSTTLRPEFRTYLAQQTWRLARARFALTGWSAPEQTSSHLGRSKYAINNQYVTIVSRLHLIVFRVTSVRVCPRVVMEDRSLTQLSEWDNAAGWSEGCARRSRR